MQKISYYKLPRSRVLLLEQCHVIGFLQATCSCLLMVLVLLLARQHVATLAHSLSSHYYEITQFWGYLIRFLFFYIYMDAASIKMP